MSKGEAERTNREERRDLLWSDAAAFIFIPKDQWKGVSTVPSTLGLIGTLIKYLGHRLDASRVLFDLWFRNRGDGLVEVYEELTFAAGCGYARNARGVRTWRQGMSFLEEFGFLRVKPKGLRKFGYVLLSHPTDAVERLMEDRPDSIPDWWWRLFTEMLTDSGATLRIAGAHEEEKRLRERAPVDDSLGAFEEEDDDLPF